MEEGGGAEGVSNSMRALVRQSTPMMKCGHSANAVDGNQNPCCVICFGHPNSWDKEIDDNPPDFTGRVAKCAYWRGGCGSTAPSNAGLAFFQAGNGVNPDEYYCGCHGWD